MPLLDPQSKEEPSPPDLPLTELSRIICEVALVCMIWPIQLCIYPRFLKIEGENLARYHLHYVLLITAIISPIIVSHFVILIYEILQHSDVLNIIRLSVASTAILSTLILLAPVHLWIILFGTDTRLFVRLNRFNWIRTLAWSVSILLSLLPIVLS